MLGFERTLHLLRSLISFDTTSHLSNLPLIHWVQTYLKEYGIESTLVPNESGQKASLIARIGPEAPGGIVCSGHTDVVPVTGQPWTTEPFHLTEKEGLYYGRGTSDMKSFLALSLALVPELLARPLKKPFYLAFSYDEEVGCLSAPELAKTLKGMGISPDLVLVGEPTEMQIVGAHKGIYSFETTLEGLEHHSSDPRKGVNAVQYGCLLVTRLMELAKQYAAKTFPGAEAFDPPYTTIHTGVMEGGTARNIIPLHCRFLWEIRTLPMQDFQEILSAFQAYAAALEQEMQQVHAGARITTVQKSSVPGLNRQLLAPFEASIQQLTGGNHLEAVSFATEAGIFQHQGFPVIVCGPGSIAQAHKPDEFISRDQLERGYRFLERLADWASA
jgi:acetylornithine deacetylase